MKWLVAIGLFLGLATPASALERFQAPPPPAPALTPIPEQSLPPAITPSVVPQSKVEILRETLILQRISTGVHNRHAARMEARNAGAQNRLRAEAELTQLLNTLGAGPPAPAK